MSQSDPTAPRARCDICAVAYDRSRLHRLEDGIMLCTDCDNSPDIVFAVGQRVAFRRGEDIFNLGYFAQGLTGTVIAVDPAPIPGDPIAVIHFDVQPACLFEDDLQVFRDDEGEVIASLFDEVA